ncbi:MAG: hypothetical protein NVSMB27_42360 [Ktedonobacteraceae bacterium]
MTEAQLEYAQKRMQQKWYDLAMAEQRGAALPALERMYNAYVLAMEEYNRCSDAYQQEHQAASDPIPVNTKNKAARSTSSSEEAGHSKLAS